MSHTYPARLRFRAECEYDVDVLKEALARKGIESRLSEIPKQKAQGPVWEFEAANNQDAIQLLRALMGVEDGHRMLQTLDVADHYDGEAFSDNEARTTRVAALLAPESKQDQFVVNRYQELFS